MAKKININKMRKELLEIYEEFLKNPRSTSLQNKAIAYDKEYAGLPSYNDVLSERAIPEDISEAIGFLFKIFQYGSGTFNDVETLKSAEKIVEKLRNKPN